MASALFGNDLEEFGTVLDQVLSPSHAIKSPEFLQGRGKQLTEVRQALSMKGRHVFIYGFRGVGKTSLAFTAANLVQSSDAQPLYVQCGPGGTFLGLIYDVLKQALPSNPMALRRTIETNVGVSKFGLSAGMRQCIEQGQLPRPESVNDAVELICFATERHSRRPVVIIDEFDHLAHDEHIHVDLFIKKLAEVDELPLKVIVCGVGETLESLFAAHLSTYRYFHTIKLDRLDILACAQILEKACAAVGMYFDETTEWRIPRISDGFPHFVHLICEKTMWAMFNDEDKQLIKPPYIPHEHYRIGARDAVVAANEELRKGYEEVVRKYSKNAEVILWAAADGHELQRKAADIYKSYQRIMDANPYVAEAGAHNPTDWRAKRLTEAQFRARIYNLCKDKYGEILSGNGRGWYEYTEKMMRGYARLKAESFGVELYPDHPLIPKRRNALLESLNTSVFSSRS